MKIIGCSDIWNQAPKTGKSYDELQRILAAEGWVYDIHIDAWVKRDEDDLS